MSKVEQNLGIFEKCPYRNKMSVLEKHVHIGSIMPALEQNFHIGQHKNIVADSATSGKGNPFITMPFQLFNVVTGVICRYENINRKKGDITE